MSDLGGDEPAAPQRSPLRREEMALVTEVVQALEALEAGGVKRCQASLLAIRQQLESLALFAELFRRYPSPLQEQVLDGRRRGLETLVDTLVATDQATFPFRAPTQAMVGRAMNMAQINFLRMLWHLTGGLPEPQASTLRESAARLLRASVYTRLVEEVLAELVTDPAVDRSLRAEGVRSLASLWGTRLTWSVHEFFPLLSATWEARQRVRVIGGTLAGSSELVQLVSGGCDQHFLDLFTEHQPGEAEVQAFREFLFGTSSEELDRLAQRMHDEGLTSIELDSRVDTQGRDAGSILFEFFRARLVQCSARRVAGLPGPRHTAEGYVMLAWLAKQRDLRLERERHAAGDGP